MGLVISLEFLNVEAFFLRLLRKNRSTKATKAATSNEMRITRTMAATTPALRPPWLDDTSDCAIDGSGAETAELAVEEEEEEEEEEEKEIETEDDEGEGEEKGKEEEEGGGGEVGKDEDSICA